MTKDTNSTQRSFDEAPLMQKREEYIQARQAHLDAATDLSRQIESLDTVLSMFNPSHVPLDIRNVQREASLLTIDRGSPMLISDRSPATTAGEAIVETIGQKKPRKNSKTPVEKAPEVVAKRGRKKVETVAVEQPAETVAAAPVKKQRAKKTEVAKSIEPVAVKSGRIPKAKADKTASTEETGEVLTGKKKQLAAAREFFRAELSKIDMSKSILEVIGESEGMTGAAITDGFAKKHNYLTDTPELRTVLSSRVSSVVSNLTTRDELSRSTATGESGKEHIIWSLGEKNRLAKSDHPEAEAA